MYESKITIAGHLGRDPEMRYTPAGVPVTDFSVAIDKSYTNKDGARIERTKWYKVTAWRGLAENCAQYLHKGRAVIVEGEINAEAYLDREGNPVAKLVITADTVKFLPRPTTNDEPADTPNTPAPANEDDGIPF